MLSAHIVKRRRDFTVDVRLQLAPGAALALFGSSGAGKSTVLACLAGLDEPDTGFVSFGKPPWFDADGRGEALPPHRRGVGLLTQQPGRFPHLSVGENVLFGLSQAEQQTPSVSRWVETLRERLQLGPFWNARPRAISGGQARRVALARTLAKRPRLLLLDEPFAGLDRPRVRDLIADLAAWRAELGFSLIAVDHQPEVLRGLCPGRVMALDAGQMVQKGTWEELLLTPATELLRSQLAPL